MAALTNPLDAERRFYRWRGYDIAYVSRGTGPAVLLLHSIHAAAWTMEWRFVFSPLAERRTVYALDLLGFGASSRPALHYTSRLYLELVHDFLRDVVGAPATLVGSSLGGTYAIATAVQAPQLVRAVCAIGPAGVTRLTTEGGAVGGVVQALLRSNFPGKPLFSALVSKACIGLFLKNIYSSAEAMPADSKHLYWEAAHVENARFAPAAFVGMRLNYDIRGLLPNMKQPMLLAWGKDAGQTPASEAAGVRALAPDCEFALLPGGDLPHEEQPVEFVHALQPFLDGLRELPR